MAPVLCDFFSGCTGDGMGAITRIRGSHGDKRWRCWPSARPKVSTPLETDHLGTFKLTGYFWIFWKKFPWPRLLD